MKFFYLLITLVFLESTQDVLSQQIPTNNLLTAAEQNSLSKVKELIQQGVSVNIPSESNLTPLMYAVTNENFEMVQLLVKHGAKINQTYGVQTAIYLADHSNYSGEQTAKQKIIADYLISQSLKGFTKIPRASDIRNAILLWVNKKWQKKVVVQLHQVFCKNAKENAIRVLCSAAIWDNVAMYEVISFKGHDMMAPPSADIATHWEAANSGTKELILKLTSTGKWTVINEYNVGDLTDESSDTKSANITITSTDAEAINKQGHYYAEKEEYDLAIEYFSKAIKLKPYLPNPYFNRGSCYANKGNFGLAIQDYTKAIELDSSDLKSYYSRGHCYSTKGEYALAVTDYMKVQNLKSDLGDVYILILPMLIRQNRLEAASKWYKVYATNGLSSFLDRPEWKYYQYYIQAATSSLVNGKYQEALELLKKAESEYKSYYQKNPNGNLHAKKDFPDVLALKGYVL